MYATLTTKKARIAFLREMLATNIKWATRGLTTIYKYQTEDEQRIGDTAEHNGVGFTGADGEILSSFADQVNKNRFRGSVKQLDILLKKMPKYAMQLDKIAQKKLEVAAA